MTKEGRLQWVSNIDTIATWTTKNNDVECILRLITHRGLYRETKITYSLEIGGCSFGSDIPRLKELHETIMNESIKNNQIQLQSQIKKFFNENF